MRRRKFLEYVLDSTGYLKEAERMLIVDFISEINESFTDDLLKEILKDEGTLNLKKLVKLYEKLLTIESTRLAEKTTLKLKTAERYAYDHFELLKAFYFMKLKSGKILKEPTCKA